jgi:hypothetical protein
LTLRELYLAQKDFARAAEQLGLTRRAAPRDIYVLRPLVKVSIKRLLSGPTNAAEATAKEDAAEPVKTGDQTIRKRGQAVKLVL